MNAPPAEQPAEDATCCLCRAASKRLFMAGGYWVRQCQSCGHQFAELAPGDHRLDEIYGDDYFSAGGAGYNDYLSEEQLLIERGRSYARRVAKFSQPGTMLDVGAAAGFTLRGFADAGWQVLGIEPNPRMAEYAQSLSQVPVEAASLESWNTSRKFDLVSMLQVLPHFVDPRRALARVSQLVRTGGHLLIETWDRSSWTARLLGKNWHEYSPPSVLHWFTSRSLVELVNKEGFSLISQGRPTRWIKAGHAKSVLRNKASSSLANRLLLNVARLIPDPLAVPYPCDDLIWLLFQRAQLVDRASDPLPTLALQSASG